jgi:DeoR family ulaG and ulaABCDEF operon transcriptional repressor
LAGGDLHREPGIVYSASGLPPEFFAARLFMGAQGIGPTGFMESNALVGREMERLLGRTDEVVILADSRKFGIRARHTTMSLSRVGTLVTDDGLSDSDAKMLESASVRLIIAKVK